MTCHCPHIGLKQSSFVIISECINLSSLDLKTEDRAIKHHGVAWKNFLCIFFQSLLKMMSHKGERIAPWNWCIYLCFVLGLLFFFSFFKKIIKNIDCYRNNFWNTFITNKNDKLDFKVTINKNLCTKHAKYIKVFIWSLSYKWETKEKKVLTWYSRLKAKLKFQITSASLQNKLHCQIGEMLPRFLCSSVIVMTSRSPSSEP